MHWILLNTIKYRVIQVTVFFNFSLTGTKGLENDKTQPFLFRIYVDILIFWYLSIARWKKIAFNWAVPKQYKFSTLQEMSTQTHPNTTNIQRHHPNTPNTSSRHYSSSNWHQQKQTDTNRHSPTFQALPGAVWGWLKVPVDVSQCLLAQPWEAIFVSPGHTETSKYQNVHIYPKQKWLGFAIFEFFSACQREFKKHSHLDHPVPHPITIQNMRFDQ